MRTQTQAHSKDLINDQSSWLYTNWGENNEYAF